MGSVRYLGFALFILLAVSTNVEARTVVKSVQVKDTEKSTLTELNRYLDLSNAAINDNAVRQLCWYIDGAVSTGTSQNITYNNIPFDFLPIDITMHVDTAPAGSALIIDINDDGSTIFGTRAEIDDAATEEDGNELYTQSEVAAGSDVTLDVDQVGSGTAGSDLSVCLYGRT